jgi:hypothetical protein
MNISIRYISSNSTSDDESIINLEKIIGSIVLQRLIKQCKFSIKVRGLFNGFETDEQSSWFADDI